MRNTSLGNDVKNTSAEGTGVFLGLSLLPKIDKPKRGKNLAQLLNPTFSFSNHRDHPSKNAVALE